MQGGKTISLPSAKPIGITIAPRICWSAQEPVYGGILDNNSQTTNQTLPFLRDISRTAQASSARAISPR